MVESQQVGSRLESNATYLWWNKSLFRKSDWATSMVTIKERLASVAASYFMNSLFSKPISEVDRILVVDDIADNSILLQTILEGEGYQVDVADSGQAALNKIAVNPPDLVLLDVMMPEMNGFEVTRQIRQNPSLPFIPILLVTGYTEPAPADGFEVGADGFIRKPIDFDVLLERVQAILQPRRSLK